LGGESNAETVLEITDNAPYLTLHNSTHEDADGGRESRLNFKGEQSGGEEKTLARIEVSHDGAADDEKGKIVLSTNDGSDGDTPTTALTIDSGQNVLVLHGLDAIGAVDMVYGSADVTDHTFTTDGSGNSEIVLPNDSIGDAEIDWGSGANQVDSDDVTEGSTNLFKKTKYEETDIFNASILPDATGEARFDTLENICTNATNTALKMLALELDDPSADCGWYGSFRIPPDYSDTPQIVIRGELNNNDGTLAFGITATPGIAANESIDQAYEAEDTANVDCTAYSDEDEFVVTITLTPASAYAAGDSVYYYCYRDFSADTQTGSVAVTNVHFRYEDR
jgi:hypothetical protein